MAVRRELRRWEICGFFFVLAAAALSGLLRSDVWALSAVLPVNGSVWERMKLLCLPFLLFTAAEFRRFCRPYRNFFAAKAAAALLGLLTVPLLHYTVTGMFGPLPPWGVWAVLAAAAAVLFVSGTVLLNRFVLRGTAWQLLGFLILLALPALFAYFTFRTPALPLFRDPVTLGYGI